MALFADLDVREVVMRGRTAPRTVRHFGLADACAAAAEQRRLAA